MERSAALELEHGLSSMLGREFHVTKGLYRAQEDHVGGIVLRLGAGRGATDSYVIRSSERSGSHWITITGSTPRAELYGAFHLLEEVAAERSIPGEETQTASVPIRWSDEWDNLDGTIETRLC